MLFLNLLTLTSLVPGEGLEPTSLAAADFKSAASANSAIPARPELIVGGEGESVKVGSIALSPRYPTGILLLARPALGSPAIIPVENPPYSPFTNGGDRLG